ncbi:MAG: hypothetical protein CVV64_04050 [Candidatus Wallbacteria bacterium HGW-Wallbacteria-1]|jgi:TolA-binding protein|uniref:Uncharacterized protein n=1 Tax=Candidatus Wallbacteria bacterium HGW-Wallbacteria-1 TaxID=2013854 RepID=A0A2N1PRI6_9BACT|nr:MAG: hypothetical protein CVV64_04050 [Candidatus Wallbacteria bacterium HGW-Wallbacteria-1]
MFRNLIILIILSIAIAGLGGCLTTSDLPATAIAQLALAETLVTQNKVDEAIEEYRRLTTQFPEDERASQAMYKTGELYLNYLSNWSAALDTFENLVTRYPKSAEADDALISLGHIYDYYKHDPSKAKQTYLKILNQYSSGNRAEDARAKLVNLQYRGY